MNLLLQHWTGEMDDLGRLSSEAMKSYAREQGADYELLRGNVFRLNLSPPCQKLQMLSPEFDRYDVVVMVDMDMFPVTSENVFELEGVGLFSKYTERVFARCREAHPKLSDPRYAYWGGAIYVLSREMRQRLRTGIRDDEMAEFSKSFHDEGIVHRLACLAKVTQTRIPDRWCQCSYLPNPKGAAMIHVRTKVTPDGPKRTKMENYRALFG